MTKKELIEALEPYDDDERVYVWGGNYITEHQAEVDEVRYRTDMKVEVGWTSLSESNIHGIYLS